MNALVLYVGTQAIAYIHSKSGTPSMSTITHSSHMDIFQNLAVDLDTEGKINKMGDRVSTNKRLYWQDFTSAELLFVHWQVAIFSWTQSPTNYVIPTVTRTTLVVCYFICLPKQILKLFRNKSQGRGCLILYAVWYTINVEKTKFKTDKRNRYIMGCQQPTLHVTGFVSGWL